MATQQPQQINTPLPREIFTTVASPSSSSLRTTTNKQWDLSPQVPPEPIEPRPLSIYERNIDREIQMDSEDSSIPEKWKTPTLIFLIIVPIIIFIFLILVKPGFVTELSSDGKVSEIRYDKVLLWTLAISVIVWVLIYGFNFCRCQLK